MKTTLETEEAKPLYRRRKQTVEPVFGIIKSAMGFLRSIFAARTTSPPSGP